MLESLLSPFTYDYMVKAIWVSALVGGGTRNTLRHQRG